MEEIQLEDGSYIRNKSMDIYQIEPYKALYSDIRPEIKERLRHDVEMSFAEPDFKKLSNELKRDAVIDEAKFILQMKRLENIRNTNNQKELNLLQKIILWIKQLFGYKKPENIYLQKQLFEEV